MIPGAEEVFALLELRAQARSERWDVIVVDCAPTAETLRLLALPEALGWYMDRVLPMERRIVKALRPVLSRATGVPMPEDSVFDALQRLHDDLHEVQELLTGKEASVRLVLTPEAVVVAEARRSLTSLSLFGYRVDGVIANRIFPDHAGDPWRDQWVAAQRGVLAEIEQSFPELPIWRSGYRPSEPVGVDELHRLVQEAYGDGRPVGAAGRGRSLDHHAPRRRRRAAYRPAVRATRRRRPGPPRRRAGDQRRVVPTSAGTAVVLGAAEGGRSAGGARSARGAVPRRADGGETDEQSDR